MPVTIDGMGDVPTLHGREHPLIEQDLVKEFWLNIPREPRHEKNAV
jgi:hypothetical protein